MKRPLLIPAIGLAIMPLAACTTIRELPKQEIRKEAETSEHELCRLLLMAFLKGNGNEFVSKLSPEQQKTFDRKEFQKTWDAMIQTSGEPVSFEYLTTLEFVTFKPHIWKIRFKRTTREGKEIYSETLFRIITGRADNNEVLILCFNLM